jgi:protein involved in ribonucleotide reduction
MSPEEIHRKELKRIGYKDDAIEEIVAKYIQSNTYEFAQEYHKAKLELTEISSNSDLYSQIEYSIIVWSIDGTKTAGNLTREIIELINKNKK